MTVAISIIYTLSLFVFVIIFFVAWYRSSEKVYHYKKFGFSMGGILLAFELYALLLLSSSRLTSPLLLIIITDTVTFFRVAAFTIMGIHYCRLISVPSFPLLMKQFGIPQAADETIYRQSSVNITVPFAQTISELKIDMPRIHEVSPKIVLPDIDKKQYFTTIMAAVTGGALFSSLLFLITKPQLSDILQRQFGTQSLNSSVTQVSFLSVTVMLEFAFAEELIFRLGIQNFMARKFNWVGDKYWIAILFSTTLWTLGHVGVMDPNWVKFAQVFPVGIVLGWLFKKYGTESSIIAHGAFNVIMLILAQYLF